MMKMVMKIQKSQVVQTDRVDNGASRTFRRTPAIQAGFKTIDLMCIGGAGGYNTQAALNYWGAGGGGGGSIKRRVLLKDLPNEFTNYYAGTKGPDGSSGGFDGGSSGFGSWVAYGGKGAGGISGGWGNSDVYASIGGEGGGNSDNTLEGGNGGNAPFGWGGLNYPFNAPENGPWTDTGAGNGHGGGGGGGAGQSNRAGYTHAATPGGYGGVSGAQSPPTTWLGGAYGGQGGGANLGLLTGVTEYIGVYSPGCTMFILS